MACLLSQALQSQDETMLRTVLRNQDDDFIKNTVKKAPSSTIPPLVKALSPYFQANTAQCRMAIKWMTQIYLCHAATLIANTDLDGILQEIRTAMTCRTANATRLRQLKGRVDLLHDQIKIREDGADGEVMKDKEVHTLVYTDRDDADIEDINSDYSEEERWAEYQSESDQKEEEEEEKMEDVHEESDDTSDSDMS